MNRIVRLILGLVLILGVTGCIRMKNNVSGSITVDGKPLTPRTESGYLIVLFIPEDRTADGNVYRANTDRDKGTFEFAEIPAGRYLVVVQQFDQKHNDALGHKFNAVNSSLHFEVADDNQVIDIDLPKK
jgi:hypothetical protein